MLKKTISKSQFFKTRDISHNLKIHPANHFTFEQLYSHYDKIGFLYPAKLKKLSPHLDLIQENWEKAWSAGRNIMWTLVYQDIRFNKIGTLTTWRTTNKGWLSQHLTSQRNAAGILALMMTAQTEGLLKKYKSAQNWYSPTNKFAMKIYGKMVDRVGTKNASSCLLNYLKVDPHILKISNASLKVVKCTNNDYLKVSKMAAYWRGEIYCAGEELNTGDIELLKLDADYQKYELSRKRHIWMAIDKDTSDPKGMIIANRGPFGFNFSLLENRCDLLVDPGIEEGIRENVCSVLLKKVSDVYFSRNSKPDYPINYLIVLADDQCTASLTSLDAVKTRQYYQGIWLRTGFKEWQKYMGRVFEVVSKRVERQNAKSD
jgi:hypothetical protein